MGPNTKHHGDALDEIPDFDDIRDDLPSAPYNPRSPEATIERRDEEEWNK